MKKSHIFSVQVIDNKGKPQIIANVKSKFNKLSDEDKTWVLNEMVYWSRQQLNNLHPEQE
jgi:hypothetical protein